MLTKVFRIELTGGKDVENDIKSISKAMGAMAASIVKAKTELAQLVSTKADPAAISSLTAKITELEAKFKSLSQERKKAEADAKTQAQAEKLLADAMLKTAQADKAAAQAEESRIKTQIAQEKEIDRMIDREKKEQQEIQKKKQLLDAEPGSYNAIKKAAQELYAVLKNANSGSTVSTNGQNFNFDQAVAEYKRLSAAEQDFRRQFTKDGTLVGEYTTGIVQAFRNMNIDDIIKNQIGGAQKQIGDLEQKTQQLVVAYRQAQQQGSKDLDKLQKEIHDNVVETENLKKAVGDAQIQLNGIGGVGDKITKSISQNFKDLKSSIGQFVLGYLGFQAAMSGIKNTVKLNFDFQDSVNELKAITGVAGNDLEFLKKQALDTSSKTKFSSKEILESFKLIASAKPELLENVSALNEIKDSAVVLAQASGQTLPEAVDSLTKVLNQFGASAEQSSSYIDALAAGAKFGAAEIPNITSALLEFGTQAKSSNISVQESIGLIELLAEKGIQGAEAGTKLRNILLALNAADALPKKALESLNLAGVDIQKLSDSTLPLEDRLKELGKIAQDNTALVQVFGKENFNAGQIVLQNIPRYAQLADQINETGVAQEQAAENTNSASVAWAKLQNQFQNMVTSDKVTALLTGLATVLSVLLGHIGLIIGIFGPLLAAFAVYRVALTITAFQQGLLNKETFAYFVLSGLRSIQQGILNGLQAVQNFLMAAYIALTIRATLATGASAIAIRALSIAVRFLTGPIGIALTLTAALVTAFGVFSASAKTSEGAVRSLAKTKAQLAAEDRVNAQLAERAASATQDQVAKIQTLTKVASDLSISYATRKKALDELIKISPKYREALQNESIDVGALTKVSNELIDTLKKQAKAKALQELTTEKEKRKIEIETQLAILGPSNVKDEKGVGSFLQNVGSALGLGKGTKGQQLRNLSNELSDIDDDLNVIYEQVGKSTDLQNAIINEAKGGNSAATPGGEETDAEALIRLRKLLKETDDQIKAIDRVKNKNTEQLAQLKRLRQVRAETLKQIREITGKQSGGNGENPIKKELDEKLKSIDASTTNDLNKLDKQHDNGLISERDYYTKIQTIVVNGEQSKIDKIFEYQEKYKKALSKYNGDLEKDVADATKKQIQAKREANQKLFDIDNKQLENDLHDQQQLQQRNLELQLSNPDLNNEQRLQAQADYFDRLLLLQIVFNQKQGDLEKKYGKKSVDNARKRNEELDKIDKQSQDNEKGRPEARQKDIQDAGDRQQTDIQRRVAEGTTAILESNSSYAKKAKDLAKLEHEATKEQLANEAATAKIALDQAEKDHAKRLISEKEYQDKLKDYKTKEAALYKLTTDEQVSATQRFINALKELRDQFKENILGIKSYSDDAQGEQERVQDATVAAQDTIKQVINEAYEAYFNNQKQKIDRDKQEQTDALDREKQQVLAKADSEAEKDAIERQYAQKQKEIDKKSAEQQKQLALKKATIDYVLAVIKTFAQFGFPLGLIPAAGLTALYLFQRSQIQQQQFAMGGNLKKKQYGLGGNANEVPVNGGVFGGKPHSQGGTDFNFNGQAYNAEVGEMNIIRTKDAPKNKVYTISGNHTQIASALNSIGGGVSFSPGAAVSKFAMGGALGSRLKAPYFSAGAYLNGGNVSGTGTVSADVQELKGMVAQIAGAVYATDAKEVQLNPGKVTKAQRKKVKDTSVGDI